VDCYLNRTDRKHRLENAAAVIQHGQTDAGLFEISGGRAIVVRPAGGGQLLLANLAPGDVFGHMPFVDIGHEPDSAAVIGSDDLATTPLDAAALGGEFDNLATIFKRMVEHLATMISVTTRLLVDPPRGKASGSK
jgi:hypothetical protein